MEDLVWAFKAGDGGLVQAGSLLHAALGRPWLCSGDCGVDFWCFLVTGGLFFCGNGCQGVVVDVWHGVVASVRW